LNLVEGTSILRGMAILVDKRLRELSNLVEEGKVLWGMPMLGEKNHYSGVNKEQDNDLANALLFEDFRNGEDEGDHGYYVLESNLLPSDREGRSGGNREVTQCSNANCKRSELS
jgi:hypothetical protein